MNDELDFTELRRVADAARPGPWHWDDEVRTDSFGTVRRWFLRCAERLAPSVIITAFEHASEYPQRPDRDFIATFNPALVKRLLDLAQENKRLRDALKFYAKATNWHGTWEECPVWQDLGTKADAALK